MDSEFGPGRDRSSVGDGSDRHPSPPRSTEPEKPRRLRDLVLFLILLVLFLEVLRQATSFTGVARITPLFLGALGAFFSAVGTVVTGVSLVRQRRSARAGGVASPKRSIGDRIAQVWESPDSRAAAVALLWVAGFAAATWLLGFVVGGGLFGIIFLRVSGHRWLSTVLTVGIPIVLFNWVIPSFLIVEIYQGILFS